MSEMVEEGIAVAGVVVGRRLQPASIVDLSMASC